jgi:hypothetical protein
LPRLNGASSFFGRRGFSLLYDRMRAQDVWQLKISIPIWLLVVLSGFYPAKVAIAAMYRWRRRSKCRCVVCDYDLRGSPGRCPECGTETERE